MEIYLSRGGERTGPYSLEEVNRQLAAGTLTPHDLGWSETSPGWKPLLSFAGVIVPGGASSTPVPIGIATPITFGLPQDAGFWRRSWALMIDAIILGIFTLVIAIWFKRPPEEGTRESALGAVLQLALILLYMPALWASPMQATAGQRICALRVINALDGDRVSFMCGLLRVLGMMLSGVILGIGFLMVAFTERKQGLHDMIAGTYVVKDSLIGRQLSLARREL
jgi:uncharacterized RDD family membrane protein YckC